MEKIKIHCLTNPVTMQDVANILLAAGGSPIMGQDPEEAEEIARLCQAVLLNTGVPDERKFQACILAGKTANMLGHPVVLVDPVGAGASVFQGKGTSQTFSGSPSGCDPLQCEKKRRTLHRWKTESTGFTEFQGKMRTDQPGFHPEVWTAAFLRMKKCEIQLALALSSAYGCTALVEWKNGRGFRRCPYSGAYRRQWEGLETSAGTGCMLSALCALFRVKEKSFFEGTAKAAELWKKSRGSGRKRNSQAWQRHWHLPCLPALLIFWKPSVGKRRKADEDGSKTAPHLCGDRQKLVDSLGKTFRAGWQWKLLLKAGVTCVQLRDKTADDGLKVYVTANILAHNQDLDRARAYLGMKKIGPDALIISTRACTPLPEKNGRRWKATFQPRQTTPTIPPTVSGTNREPKEWYPPESCPWRRSAKSGKIFPKRWKSKPLCMEPCAFLIPEDAFSAIISPDGMPNRGNAPIPAAGNMQSWKNRPGEYLPVYENERGTFIFNSKDLCMIEHIPELMDTGIDSFKIEGRMKTARYVATVARTYRKAIDDYLKDPALYQKNMPWYQEQISNCT